MKIDGLLLGLDPRFPIPIRDYLRTIPMKINPRFNSLSKRDFSNMLRKAFTLVELLVVIAIIGVLVGLLLPAVQAAREAARRLQCANNVKQLTLAIHNYESMAKAFPLTTTGPSSTSPPLGNGFYSWLAMILPQVEQQPLFDAMRFDLPMADPKQFMRDTDYNRVTISSNHPNAVLAATAISAYLCPSDSVVNTAAMGTGRASPGSYAGNVGWIRGSRGIDGSLPPLTRHNGAMPIINPAVPDPWQVARLGFRDFTDGTSNTAVIAERLINNAEPIAGPFGSYMPPGLKESVLSFCAGGGSSNFSLPRWVSYCDSVTEPDPTYSLPHGRAWVSGWTLAGNLYMHVMPINGRNCHLYGGQDDGTNLVTASSNHHGGATVAYADGHVDFISEQVDMRVWWAIGSRNGGEVVPPTP